jgi:hypothetical protein
MHRRGAGLACSRAAFADGSSSDTDACTPAPAPGLAARPARGSGGATAPGGAGPGDAGGCAPVMAHRRAVMRPTCGRAEGPWRALRGPGDSQGAHSDGRPYLLPKRKNPNARPLSTSQPTLTS